MCLFSVVWGWFGVLFCFGRFGCLGSCGSLWFSVGSGLYTRGLLLLIARDCIACCVGCR